MIEYWRLSYMDNRTLINGDRGSGYRVRRVTKNVKSGV